MAKEPHPEDELAALESALEKGRIAPGYVLRGPEPYFRERGIAALRRAATERGMEPCAHDLKDPDFEPARLFDDLGGAGLFAAERLVVVRHPGALLKKQGSHDATLTRAIVGFVERGAGTVVVAADTLRADHKVARAIQKAGGALVSCRRLWDSPPPWKPGADLSDSELCHWLAGRAQRIGLKLQRQQAALLCASYGNDPGALETELEKLRASGPDALAALGLEGTATPFKIADDLIGGRAGAALFGVETLFKGGFQQDGGRRERNPVALGTMLCAAISKNVRQALAGAEAVARGADVQAAARAAGVSGAPMAQRTFEARLSARTFDEWRRLFDDALELERRAKSGARLDVNDFARVALRWRVRRQARTAAAGRRGARR